MKHNRLPQIFIGFLIIIFSAFAVNAQTNARLTQIYLPWMENPGQIPSRINFELFATGFSLPFGGAITDIAHAGDERLFVIEQPGRIKIVNPDGSIKLIPFLDITNSVRFIGLEGWEAGLLGIAFHPNYPETPHFYVAYTPEEEFPNDFRLRISRFTVSADPDIADPNSELIMIEYSQDDDVHHGGDLAFGKDGYLYIPLGDGGPDPFPQGSPFEYPGDEANNSQDLTNLRGSLLRIDVDQTTGLVPDCGGAGYSIPADNPFVDGVGGNCDEIWAYGIRNGWKMAIDRGRGDIYLTDVGEWYYDEINFFPYDDWPGPRAGANLGWHCYEGTLFYPTIWPEIMGDCPDQVYAPPMYEYSTAPPNQQCSITGGMVYRGLKYPALRGQYIFSDFCTGEVWRIDRRGPISLWKVADNQFLISTMGEGADGEIYMGKWYPPGQDEDGDGVPDVPPPPVEIYRLFVP